MTLKRSWTKAALTIPFLPVSVCVGEPVLVPEGETETRAYQIRVAAGIASLARWASRWAGGAGRAPFKVARD